MSARFTKAVPGRLAGQPSIKATAVRPAQAVLAGGTQSVRYASAQNFGGFRRRIFNSSNGQVSSVAVGLNVTNGGGGPTGSLSTLDSLPFVTPFELNTQDPTRMLIGSSSYFYESADQGDTLTRLNWGNSSGSPRALAYGGPGNADLIWTSGNNAATELMVRTTSSGSLSLVATYPGNFAEDIVVDSSTWQTAYLIDSSGKVYRTTDAGATGGNWTDLTGNLNTIAGTGGRAITFVPGFVIVGTQLGTYFMKTASPGTWYRLGGGLPTVPVNDLRYDSSDDLLYVGTLGRGVWRLPTATTELSETTAPTGSFTALGSPSLPVDEITITFTEPINGLELSDFAFKRNGSPLTLNSAVHTLRTDNFATWVIGGLMPLTNTAANYTIDLIAATAGVFDGAGNLLANSPSDAFTFTVGIPFVTDVSSSTANGIYLPNVAINVAVTFSGVVNVTGTPTLALALGFPAAVATYLNGSGSSVLNFTYTIQAGQQTMDLEYTSSSALTLSGGTIQDGSSQNALLTLPSPGQTSSLSANKAIVVRPRSTVSSHTPTVKVGSSLSTFDVLFAQTMDTTSFAFVDDMVSFTGPSGDLSGAVTTFSWPNTTTLRINFATQSAAGSYTFVLGPQVLSASGSNPLDQNANNLFGEMGGDNYSAAIHLVALNVSKIGDSDDGNYVAGQLTLREAVNLANANSGADTISFDTVTFLTPQTITLSSQLSLTDPVTITGNGASLITISGNNTVRIFNIDKSSSTANAFSLNNLTLANGYSGASAHGGAILNNDESLTINGCILEDNSAVLSGGAIRLQTATATLNMSSSTVRNNKVSSGTGSDTGDGGGISVRASSTVIVTNSTISGNSANDDGGGIYFFSGGSLTMTGSTVSGNNAKNADGGGIYGFSTTMTLTNSTIAQNSAVRGGGIAEFSSSKSTISFTTIAANTATTSGGGLFNSSSSYTLNNSIVGNNVVTGSPDISGSATATNSLISNTTGATISGSGNIPNQDPQLEALANNGGLTQTMALKAASPAINKAGSTTISLDQRGAGFPRTVESIPDIGALEFSVSTVTVSLEQAGGQADPATTSPIQFTVVFNAPVTNFATGDVNLGGTANPTNVSIVGSGTTYTVSVSGMTSKGTVTASIPPGAVSFGSATSTASTSADNTVDYQPVLNIELDGSGNLVIDTGSGKADNITIKIVGSNYQISDTSAANKFAVIIAGSTGNNTNVVTVPISAVTGSQIQIKTNDLNDAVAVDLSGGSFVPSITYDGGPQTSAHRRQPQSHWRQLRLSDAYIDELKFRQHDRGHEHCCLHRIGAGGHARRDNRRLGVQSAGG